MKGKEAIIDFFERRNTTHIFHLPGIHTLPLCETLNRSRIQAVTTRHEANAIFMADGFARASGKAGIVLVSPGPGLGNTVTGCMEAMYDDVPLIIVFIDVNRRDVAKGILHGLADPIALFSGIIKGAFVVTQESELLVMLDQAYRMALSPRQGPVLVSIPYRLMEKEVAATVIVSETEANTGGVDLQRLEWVLKDKRKPVLVGGKGLMDPISGALIGDLCEGANIPLFTTVSAKGLVSDDKPYSFGAISGRGAAGGIFTSADVVIAVGTKLRYFDVKSRGVKLPQLIHVDVDGEWAGRNYATSFSATGEMTQTLVALSHLMKSQPSSWCIDGLQQAIVDEREVLKEQPGWQITDLLRNVIPRDTTTVWDSNLISLWAEHYFPVFRQRSFIIPRGMTPIFYALPAAIGAYLGCPDFPCLCVAGDGSFLGAVSELATIKKYNIPLVMLVYNNNGYGVLEDYMRKRTGTAGTMDLSNPDFVSLAESFGIRTDKAESLNQLHQIFAHYVHWDQPYLIEFSFPVFSPPWF
jgi:thiamine pyrophosphate-dependent acetolactate synthase large subunit-like protein